MCNTGPDDLEIAILKIIRFLFENTDKSSEFCWRNLKFMLYEKERDKERGARFS